MEQHYKFVNTPLPYPYDALEPYIDTLTMTIHHDRHLQTYIDNLNRLLADYPQLQARSLEQLLAFPQALPAPKRTAILNNAGGVYNHFFYFNSLAPAKRGEGISSSIPIPDGNAAALIERSFSSFESFLTEFKAAAMSVFGSGYAYLVLKPDMRAVIITLPNQDTPLAQNLLPLLNIDVWEHAYYLKNVNMRANYIDDYFKVVNWTAVNDRLSNARR